MTTGEKMIWAAAFVAKARGLAPSAAVLLARQLLAKSPEGADNEDVAMLREMVGEEHVELAIVPETVYGVVPTGERIDGREDIDDRSPVPDPLAAVREHVKSDTTPGKCSVVVSQEWFDRLRVLVGVQ